jgi:hypothetical protein
MTLKPYLIAADDADDTNYDLLVQAASPIDAIELWRDYHSFEEQEITSWDGPFVKAIASGDEDARVFEVQINQGIPGALPWVTASSQQFAAGQLRLIGHIAYAP